MTIEDDARRFGGIARLYSQKNLDYFSQAHVCVVGLGGVGSWCVEALARTGIGQMTLIDLDNVALSNVNRQQPAVTSQIGMPKVDAMARRVQDISPNCRLNLIEDFVEEENLVDIFATNFDFVVDAIDQVKIKAAMANHFLRKKQNFVVSGGAGGRTDLKQIEQGAIAVVTHDPLLANMRYTLRKQYGYKDRESALKKVNCVFSRQPFIRPEQAEQCDALQGLSCAGFGASMMVTASFGLACATAAVESIIKQSVK